MVTNVRLRLALAAFIAAVAAVAGSSGRAAKPGDDVPAAAVEPVETFPGGPYPLKASDAPAAAPFPPEVLRCNDSCLACHQGVHDPHFKRTVRIGCVECHGGDGGQRQKERAHVAPRFPQAWRSAANPVRSYTLLNRESPEFIQFVNPGDLRVAHIACGNAGCHGDIVTKVKMNMMTHGGMLWGAALYNNGALLDKPSRFGESYGPTGAPQRLRTIPSPTKAEIRDEAMLAFLDPLMRFEISQPGNVLRIFERGGRFRPEIGVPEREEEPGRPRTRLSERGLGTQNRTDPVFVGLNKTRLFDPTLNFLGTNDHPGDYRSSGCTACHVIYANSGAMALAGPFAAFGNKGTSFQNDPMIPMDEPGHPIQHRWAVSIPSSQCMVCHNHPGTALMNSYLGMMWWDLETDAKLLYPKEQRRVTESVMIQSQLADPNEASARGLWGTKEFQENIPALNKMLEKSQFAEMAGHGWMFRAVFKKDRAGNLLDFNGDVVETKPEEHSREPGTTAKPLAEIQQASHVEKSESPATLREKLYKAMESSVRKKPDGNYEVARKVGKEWEQIPVHLEDVHQRAGMHCVDCHFLDSMHGNGKLYGELRAAVEIACIDCHGTVAQKTTFQTSGPMSRQGSKDLRGYRTPFGKPRFEETGAAVVQNSMVYPGVKWEVPQTADVVNPLSKKYNQKAAFAKTLHVNRDGSWTWGVLPKEGDDQCVHANKNMNCTACHSSWNQSCSGCHLPQKANRKLPDLHNEGDVSRNYVSYNFQTLRDDVFMLGRDGLATGNKINPARSSCTIHVTSYNGNREAIYQMQQTISGCGLAGTAFSTNVPHTVSGGPPLVNDVNSPEHGRPQRQGGAYLPGRNEIKTCTDCHVSKADDNNAWLAQILMQGTNFTNFIGRWCWVGVGDAGIEAVAVTERTEPQCVIGGSMHETVYPHNHEEHVRRGMELEHAHEHPAKDISDNLLHPFRGVDVQGVLQRGEYIYCACGKAGLKVIDIAFVENKAFAERIVSTPVSPFGQRFYVDTTYATAVAAPNTMAADPTRKGRPANHEVAPHISNGYLYVTDLHEGLICVLAATLLDGNPINNFLKKDVVFNPNGILNGARNITIAGTYAYICCNAGIVVVSIDDPTKPKVVCVVGPDVVDCATDVQIQFRYAFVCDKSGVKVFDVTDLAHPRPSGVLVSLEDARRIYVARTYAYVAAGAQGLVILNVEKPLAPKIDQIFNADGLLCDVRDVKLGITYTSEYAYIANGKRGLAVVELTSPELLPDLQALGWSPRPRPKLVAVKPIKHGEAKCISKGLDRDRAVDEVGNQVAVFGRVGARPFNFAEQRKMYLDKFGKLFKVSDDPNDFKESYRPPVGYTPVWKSSDAAAKAR